MRNFVVNETMEKKLSVTAFANEIGISHTAVYKAIKTGRIVGGVRYDENGKAYIIPEIAKTELGRNQDGLAPSEEVGDLLTESQKAKQQQEIFKAEKLRLDVEEKQGKLIDKQQAYRALFAMGVEIRTALLGVPDRVVDDMMASTTRHEAHKILYDALESELLRLASILERDIAK